VKINGSHFSPQIYIGKLWGAVELGWTQAPSATLSIEFIIDSVHLEVYVLD